MTKPISICMVVICRSLENGPLGWTKLRNEYFGERRSKGNPASTSFFTKLKKGIADGYVVKDAATKTYGLTTLGEETIAAMRETMDVDAAKTPAQITWENENPIAEAIEEEVAEEVEA